MENLLFLGVPILKHIRVFSSAFSTFKAECPDSMMIHEDPDQIVA